MKLTFILACGANMETDTDRPIPYIIFVHGTWSAPSTTSPSWYDPGSSDPDHLACRLTHLLNSTPLEGATQRPLPAGSRYFSWSGQNTHEARLEAARSLYRYLADIYLADSHCCFLLIAHSHGGNVLLKALDQYITAYLGGHRKVLPIGAIVFLGTPFLFRFWPFAHSAWRRVLATFTDFFFVFCFLLPPIYLLTIVISWAFSGLQWLASSVFSILSAIFASVSFVIIITGPVGALLVGIPLALVFLLIWLPPFSPLGFWIASWPISGFSLLVLLALLFSIINLAGTRRTEHNIYFTDALRRSAAPDPPPVHPIPALVLSSPIDEALLGLSSEPFLSTWLIALLQLVAKQDVKWNIFANFGDDQPLAFSARQVISNVFGIVSGLAWNFALRVVEPIVRRYLLLALHQAAFGVSQLSATGARIRARSSIGVATTFEEEAIDVSIALLNSLRQSHRNMAQLVDFKTIEGTDMVAELESEARATGLWDSVEANLARMRRQGAISQDDLNMTRVSFLSQVVLLNKRFEEIRASTLLYHSEYYQSSEIAKLVADWLVDRFREYVDADRLRGQRNPVVGK